MKMDDYGVWYRALLTKTSRRFLMPSSYDVAIGDESAMGTLVSCQQETSCRTETCFPKVRLNV
jgi:hypothetical protein